MFTTGIAGTAEITDPLDEWRLSYEVGESPLATTTVEADDVRNKVVEASSYRTSLGTSDLRLALRLALGRFPQTAHSTQPPVLADTLRIDVSPALFPISFATVPTHVEPQAALFLAWLPWTALRPVLQAASEWVSTAPVRAANVCLVSQSADGETWDEAVVQFQLEVDTPTALSLWDSFSRRLDAARLALAPHDREAIDRNLSFHFSWGDDPWS